MAVIESSVPCGTCLRAPQVEAAHDLSVKVLVGVLVLPVNCETPTAVEIEELTTPSGTRSRLAKEPMSAARRLRAAHIVSPRVDCDLYVAAYHGGNSGGKGAT
ncbi:MAG TPA: hypothetical protein VFP89_01760 [Propionibacteriaceae bacterium]|nr:hypothetical protein [Propionibacteriaceae bacterium]